MKITMRPAKREDAQQMLQVYNCFTKQFVGSASRTLKPFRRMMRKKDNINWVACNGENQIIGYAHARLDKRINRGEFREIVVNPKHAFEPVAKALVEKISEAFMEKKVAAIDASSLRNPMYEKLFPALGFFESESMGVFMYAVLDVQKFLNEISPVFVNRLKQVENWNGLAQIECEGHAIYLRKANGEVEPLVWTNQHVDFKVILNRGILTKLVFGVLDSVECLKNDQLKVETILSQDVTKQLLKVLFPKKQFLIMDYW